MKIEKSISRQSVVNSQQPEAKLIIETSLVNESSENYKQPASQTSPKESPGTNLKSQTKLSALDKIRKQVKGNGNNGNGNPVANMAIEIESLQAAWHEYAQKLKSEKILPAPISRWPN